MSTFNPMSKECYICGAVQGERCTDIRGNFLGITHPQRNGRLTDFDGWQDKYDALYRVEPEGGYFGKDAA
jgi:hypothetical protein